MWRKSGFYFCEQPRPNVFCSLPPHHLARNSLPCSNTNTAVAIGVFLSWLKSDSRGSPGGEAERGCAGSSTAESGAAPGAGVQGEPRAPAAGRQSESEAEREIIVLCDMGNSARKIMLTKCYCSTFTVKPPGLFSWHSSRFTQLWRF